MNGYYQGSVINAPALSGFNPFGGPQFGADANGNLIAYNIDSSNASKPMLQLFNMTLGNRNGRWFRMGSTHKMVYGSGTQGLVWSKPIFTSVDGGAIKDRPHN